MLVTARLKTGLSKNRGTVGHATSTDLKNWQVQPPLTGETSFSHLEVFQIIETKVGYTIVFCTSAADIDSNSGIPRITGTFSAPADSPTGPFHFDKSELIDEGNYYAGRIVTESDGTYHFLGFENGPDQGFTGRIGDPRKVELTDRGTFKVI
jgi:beta-fructofuranosidase